MNLKQKLADYWFQPYTPIIFLCIVIFTVVWFLTPTIKQALHPNPSYLRVPTPTLSPIQNTSSSLSREAVLARVGKLIDLPTNETPTIANITDVQKFQDQPFFKKAHSGDLLLIYEKNKKAILYNPSENKILEIAPILEPTQATASATPSARPH